MGQQLAGGCSSWCPELESRTTHRSQTLACSPLPRGSQPTRAAEMSSASGASAPWSAPVSLRSSAEPADPRVAVSSTARRHEMHFHAEPAALRPSSAAASPSSSPAISLRPRRLSANERRRIHGGEAERRSSARDKKRSAVGRLTWPAGRLEPSARAARPATPRWPRLPRSPAERLPVQHTTRGD